MKREAASKPSVKLVVKNSRITVPKGSTNAQNFMKGGEHVYCFDIDMSNKYAETSLAPSCTTRELIILKWIRLPKNCLLLLHSNAVLITNNLLTYM